jgi:kelch-like protein 10
MKLILECAYIRNVNISVENMYQLLASAVYSSVLRNMLVPENCIGIMRFARDHFCCGLEGDP